MVAPVRAAPDLPRAGRALYPRYGFEALAIVPRLAYALDAPLLYRYLRRFASPPAAALATLWYVRAPQVRQVAGLAMTDAPALLFWTATLDGAARVARTGRGWAGLAGAIGLLSFTRPLPYLPLGAGAALLVSGVRCGASGARSRAGAASRCWPGSRPGRWSWSWRAPGCPRRPPTWPACARAGRRDSAWSRRLRTAARPFGLADEPHHPLWRWYASAVALTGATSCYLAARAVVPPLALGALLWRRAARGRAGPARSPAAWAACWATRFRWAAAHHRAAALPRLRGRLGARARRAVRARAGAPPLNAAHAPGPAQAPGSSLGTEAAPTAK